MWYGWRGLRRCRPWLALGAKPASRLRRWFRGRRVARSGRPGACFLSSQRRAGEGEGRWCVERGYSLIFAIVAAAAVPVSVYRGSCHADVVDAPWGPGSVLKRTL
jgi:hypothetical protein